MMMVRMGLEPILSVKRSVSIDTMIKFDGDVDRDGMCKQALKVGVFFREKKHYHAGADPGLSMT